MKRFFLLFTLCCCVFCGCNKRSNPATPIAPHDPLSDQTLSELLLTLQSVRIAAQGVDIVLVALAEDGTLTEGQQARFNLALQANVEGLDRGIQIVRNLLSVPQEERDEIEHVIRPILTDLVGLLDDVSVGLVEILPSEKRTRLIIAVTAARTAILVVEAHLDHMILSHTNPFSSYSDSHSHHRPPSFDRSGQLVETASLNIRSALLGNIQFPHQHLIPAV